MRVSTRSPAPDGKSVPARPHTPSTSSGPERPESPSLGGSWYPVGSVADTGTEVETDSITESDLHEDDVYEDDNSSLDLSSSIELSLDGSTTGTRSPIDDIELDDDTAGSLTSSLIMRDYVDAESPPTILGLEDSVPQVELVYPYPLEDSFASSLTVSDTTPTASVGSLHPSAKPNVGPRSSKYRLEAGSKVSDSSQVPGQAAGQGSLWSPSTHLLNDSRVYDNQTTSSVDSKSSSTNSALGVQVRDGSETDSASERLLRTAKGISQKWSLRMSLIALTSIVSIAVATVQYSPIATSSTSSDASRSPHTHTQAPRPFSILDYLPIPIQINSLPEPIVTLSSSGPSSYMPDVRLIKNALSLSTKSNAQAPAMVQSTNKSPKSQSQQTHTAKNVGPTSYSLSLRNTDVALTTIIDVSTKWHRSLRNFGRGPDGIQVGSTAQGQEKGTGYDRVARAKLQSATYDAISEGRILHVFYYVHLQLIALLRSELDEAIAMGRSLVGWTKNATQSTGTHAKAGASYLHQHFTMGLHSLAKHAHAIRAVKAEEVRVVSQKAKSSLETLSEQASLTSKKGKEYIHQARAGLVYLIAEGKRRRGHVLGESKEETHGRVPAPFKGQGRARRQDVKSQCGKSRRTRWSRHQASCGGIAITPPAAPAAAAQNGKEMSWTQKAFRAIHDAAPALIF